MPLQNHLLKLGSDIGFFEDLGNDRVRDVFGVVWDRRVDKDIGIVEGCLLPEPTLAGYRFPDPLDRRFFADIPAKIARSPRSFPRLPNRVLALRAGLDAARHGEPADGLFDEPPISSTNLLDAIADYNIAQVREALKYDIDAVYFGDDWGQQHGLQMGPATVARVHSARCCSGCTASSASAGKFVLIHSCGDVDELFDDLIEAGLNCFNPFQPEVMDVYALLPRYRGRLAFHGGLSTQRTLPYGSRGGRARGDRSSAGAGPRGRLHLRPGPRRGGRRAAGEHAGVHRDPPSTTGLSRLEPRVILIVPDEA